MNTLDIRPELTDDSIVHLIHHTIQTAIDRDASDIHWEPYEHFYRIRLRRQGMLESLSTLDLLVAHRLSTSIKVMAQLDIAERRLPQDGRFSFAQGSRSPVECRVNVLPMLFGEKIVMRLLSLSQMPQDFDALGYTPFQRDTLLHALNQSKGLILMTGPTGSGKTTSLYAALNYLNTINRNLSTCENPVEMHLPGVNQVHVHPKIGLNFANTLRALLRQDPDVIMIGEIRDLETAEIAIQAAQTGHLVLSTLHTNTAVDTITRLLSMGVPEYQLQNILTLIIAQRLVRVLCPLCKMERPLSLQERKQYDLTEKDIPASTVFEPQGCITCQSGFHRRIGIYEMLTFETATASDIHNTYKQEPLWTLKQSGLQKVDLGLTSLNELFRVLPSVNTPASLLKKSESSPGISQLF